MKYKRFISDNGRFWFHLHEHWEEYNDTDDETYAFFNPTTAVWSGNLRITHITWKLPASSEVDKGSEMVAYELQQNQGAEKIKLGRFIAARYYKKSLNDKIGPLIIWYWVLGSARDLFICTFTAPDSQNAEPFNPAQFEVVESMLNTIQIAEELE